jgi:hypothetical protein
MKNIPNNQKLLNFPIFLFLQILNGTIFLQRLLKRRITLVLSFLDQIKDVIKDNKSWSKKTSTFSTLFPNQTHNVRKK